MFVHVFTAWLRLTAVTVLSAAWSSDYRTVVTIYVQLGIYWCGKGARKSKERQEKEDTENEA